MQSVDERPVPRAELAESLGINSSQAGSAHLEDQLPLMVQKTLHPVWREPKDIEANLEKRDTRSADPEPIDRRILEIRQVLMSPDRAECFAR